MRQAFQKELKLYSYFIPPNFVESFGTAADGTVIEKIDNLKTSLELQKFIAAKNYAELLDRTKYDSHVF